MGSFSFSFRHHSNVIRMGHHSGKGIYGEQDGGAHSQSHSNTILMSFVWD